MAKTGILLVNLGTPDAPTRSAVYRYLKQFLSDPRVIDQWFVRNLIILPLVVPLRAGQSAKGYQKLWTSNGSPLKHYGERLTAMVGERLGSDFSVELAMRYQNPSIESALERLFAQKVSRVVVLPLFPHYASASTGSVHEEIFRILSKRDRLPELKMISSFPTMPEMIDVFAENGQKMGIEGYDHVLFSYHGVPERHMKKGDEFGHCKCNFECCQTLTATNQLCYTAQCYATTRELVKKLGLSPENYTVSFQSRLGRDPWVKPYTVEVLEDLATKKGMKRVLVFCPAFVADCLETTVEIVHEYREEFQKWGGEVLDLVPSLNDSPRWADAVAVFLRSA